MLHVEATLSDKEPVILYGIDAGYGAGYGDFGLFGIKKVFKKAGKGVKKVFKGTKKLIRKKPVKLAVAAAVTYYAAPHILSAVGAKSAAAKTAGKFVIGKAVKKVLVPTAVHAGASYLVQKQTIKQQYKYQEKLLKEQQEAELEAQRRALEMQLEAQRRAMQQQIEYAKKMKELQAQMAQAQMAQAQMAQASLPNSKGAVRSGALPQAQVQTQSQAQPALGNNKLLMYGALAGGAMLLILLLNRGD